MSVTWKDIGNGVSKVAPWVGSLLYGKAGEAVGNLIAQAIGTESTPEAVSAELVKNPEAFLKIRELETTKETELARLQSEDYRAELVLRRDEINAEVADRQSARNRQVDLYKVGYRDKTQEILAAIAIIGFFVTLFVLIYKTVPDGNARDALLIMLGALVVIVKDVYGYYFGSSKGSADKNILFSQPQGSEVQREKN